MPSPFDTLGVDPDADEAAIVDAYRERVKETHPDHGGSASEFQAVQVAYERVRSGAAAGGRDAGQPPGAEQAGGSTSGRQEGERIEATVEYLNYEVLDDHGWGLDDGDLFEKAAAAGLDAMDHGELTVCPGESLLEAAEGRGFAWPYACRGGACANCAVGVVRGDLSMPVDHVLPREMLDRGVRLSCNGVPLADEMQVVYNLKHLPDLDDLRLPPYPFDLANSSD